MSERPQRIQITRRKGADYQAESRALNGLEAVNCKRPGVWGNPWRVVQSGSAALWMVRRGDLGKPQGFFVRRADAIARAVLLHRLYMTGDSEEAVFMRSLLPELRGRNLGCSCALPKPGEPDVCHAATLLELANK